MSNSFTLQVRSLCKSFDGIQYLKNVSFDLVQGEVIGVVGNNASSKTVLIKSVSGAILPEEGNVQLVYDNGRSAAIKSPTDARNHGIIVLHEDIMLYDHFTVAENIYFGAYRKRFKIINHRQMNSDAQALCRQYGFDIDTHKNIRKLNIAEKQIVALLHAVVLNARILIVDEAFSALDFQDITKILGIIRMLRHSGVAVLYISQSLEYASLIADSIIVINEGQTSPKVLSDSPDLKILCEEYNLNFNQHIPYPKLDIQKGIEQLRCEHLSFKNIVNDVSLSIHYGEILGIVGATGSGRTTLARLLCGDLRLDHGDIYINNQHVEMKSPCVARKHSITLILDDRSRYGIFQSFDLSNNLIFPNYQRVYARYLPVINHRQLKTRVEYIIRKLAIKHKYIQQNIADLSAGNQQKVLLARGLFAHSELFIFDEPTRGVDIPGKVQLYNLLNEIARNGKSVVFITSDISEAVGMCDRVLVLRKGTLIAELSKPELVYNNIQKLLFPPV